MPSVPWSELYRRRREVNDRYPGVHSLPRTRRATRLLEPHLRQGVRILEVGAGPEPRGPRLVAKLSGATAVSVDPDPAGDPDHARVEDVRGIFDVAIALEVIEHLPLAEGLDLLRNIRERLAKGGVLLVSTPNVFCPGAFLRDATHVTPYAWDELGGALLLAGYEVIGLYRVVPGSWLKRAGKAVVSPIGRALGLDHAPSVAALATPR